MYCTFRKITLAKKELRTSTFQIIIIYFTVGTIDVGRDDVPFNIRLPQLIRPQLLRLVKYLRGGKNTTMVGRYVVLIFLLQVTPRAAPDITNNILFPLLPG